MQAVKEISLACLVSTKKVLIDDLQMSIKCPTSEEQSEQEAVAHFDRSSFFYLSALMVETRCSAYLPVLCTQLHASNANSNSYSLELKLYS